MGNRMGIDPDRHHVDGMVLAQRHSRGREVKQRFVHDVSQLPTYGFGSTSPIWWGTLGFVALEGTGFALAAGAYLYPWQVNGQWPLSVPPPSHWPGTVMLSLLLASLWPNVLVDRAARDQHLGRVRLWLIVMSVLCLVAVG